jgi:hypothetical protein
MLNIVLRAGAASRYGSDQMMRLQLCNTGSKAELQKTMLQKKMTLPCSLLHFFHFPTQL